MRIRYPLRTIYIYLTAFCNLACQHCWVRPGLPKRELLDKEINCQDLTSLLEQAKELGLSNVKITGGEPLLRPSEVIHLLHECNRLEVDVRMETNGVLVTADVAEQIVEAKCGVCMSIDSHRPEFHNRFRGSQQAFENALEGLQLFAEHNHSVTIVMSVFRDNVQDIVPLALMLENFVVPTLKLNPVMDTGRAVHLKKQGRLLDISETLELTREIDTAWKDLFKVNIEIDLPVAFKSFEYIRQRGTRHCEILETLGVLSDGSFSLCGIAKEFPSLKGLKVGETSLKEAWEEAPFLIDLRKANLDRGHGVCRECMFVRSCKGHCAAHIYAERGGFCYGNPICQEAFDRGLFPKKRLIPA